jgi:hypothetical protein
MTARAAITTANVRALTAGRVKRGPPLLRIGRGADVAQLVERELPKLEVAGSRPVVRFRE